METVEPVVDTIHYYNLGDVEEIPEQSQDIELIQEEFQHEEDVVTQEPTSPKFYVEETVHTEGCWYGNQKRDTITKELVFLKSFVDAAMQTEVSTMKEDVVT